MNILSLFDGMSCGQIALNNLGIKYNNYYASEVDKYAIKVTQHNYPKTIQLGDITKLEVKRYNNNLRVIRNEKGKKYFLKGDLWLFGGSPCQGFSFAGKMKGSITKCNKEVTTLEQYIKLKKDGFEFQGQSYLFWEYIRILRELKPDIFLLENVKMKNKWKQMFNDAVGVKPLLINSSLVSAQSRPRMYWTNIENIPQPDDLNITIKDILQDESEVDEKYYISDNAISKLQVSNSKGGGLTETILHRGGYRRNTQVFNKDKKNGMFRYLSRWG